MPLFDNSTTVDTLIAQLQAVKDEHGPDTPVDVFGNAGQKIIVKADNKPQHRGNSTPAWRAVIHFR